MMKKIKLHQWFALLVCATIIFAACSKKTFTLSNSNLAEEKFDSLVTADSAYTPPAIITVSDDKAKTNKDDELYYDDENGYRYWRYNDGKYYLDKKYSKALLLKKKTAVAKLTALQK